MAYPEVLANARECIGKYCKACPVCNGVACKNQIDVYKRQAYKGAVYSITGTI